MAHRFAFAGFRHDHIFSLYTLAQQRNDIDIVAACEEDAATRDGIAKNNRADITHDSLDAMLGEVECDVVAIGDYYAQRGATAIAALARGKHIIADKPLCTRLDELETIARLATEKSLRVGCMLDNRDRGQYIALRTLIHDNVIGEIHAIAFGGQHPLNLGNRPAWYFEPGKHGGTINDIAIHALDLIPWLTGLAFKTVNAARTWNAFAPDFPHFNDAAQFMLTMQNGCGVLGDVSYFGPNSMGYSNPFYWRMTFWGRKGVAETCQKGDVITLALDGNKEMESVPNAPDMPGDYLEAFLDDIGGARREDALNTDSVLNASRVALQIQKAADEGTRDIALR